MLKSKLNSILALIAISLPSGAIKNLAIDLSNLDSETVIQLDTKSSYKLNLENSGSNTSIKAASKKLKAQKSKRAENIFKLQTAPKPFATKIQILDKETNESNSVRVQAREDGVACIEIYEPVCGLIQYSKDDQVNKTYPNDCYLYVDGAQLLHTGECD